MAGSEGAQAHRYTLTSHWVAADGRSYAPGDVTMSDRDAMIRLYRTMRDHPNRFDVPKDALLFVVGPVRHEVMRGGSWSYGGTPAASVAVIDRYSKESNAAPFQIPVATIP